MHLMITNAGDVTSDLLCHRLGDTVLRVNWEQWNEYEVDVTCSGFRVADHFGRVVTAANIGNVIWRKPVADVDVTPGEYWYSFHEFKYGIEYIIDYVRSAFPLKLPIDPQHNRTVGKIKQLILASKHLAVPAWRVTSHPSRHEWEGAWVVKSMTGQPIPGTGAYSKVIYTTAINPSDLADNFPWFLQQQFDAGYDLTVVYVDGRQFGFLLARNLFPGLDWRRSIGDEKVDGSWVPAVLPQKLTDAICRLMQDLRLRFGRLDLLATTPDCEDVAFLEVNPNGQWAWLDLGQDNGLFDAMVTFLTSE